MTNYLDYLLEKKVIVQEARVDSEDVTYSIDKAKNKLELFAKGSKYASKITKIARQFENLKKSSDKISVMLKDKNEEIKNHCKDLMNADDILNQLIVKTSQSVITIAKPIQKADAEVKDYASAWDALYKLLSEDLTGMADELLKQFTTVKKAKEQDFLSRGLTIKNKEYKKTTPTDDELNESFNLQKFVDGVKALYAKFKDWKNSYLTKLTDVKKMFKNAQ